MPIRWVINPVVDKVITDAESGATRTIRAPKISMLIDAGTGRPYAHSSAIQPNGAFALSFVRAIDFTAIDADPQCNSLFDGFSYEDGDGFLGKRLTDQFPNISDRASFRAKFAGRAVDVRDLGDSDHLWRYVERMGKKIVPEFTPRGTWVSERVLQ